MAYKPLLDEAIEISSHKPDFCIVYQREQVTAGLVAGRDEDWNEAVAGAAPADCVPVAATDPLYILYTSGTTGQPKGVIRDNGGHMVALHWSMKNIYGVEPGETYWAASGRRLGGRPLLYRLRPPAARQYDHPVRRQTGWHAGRRGVLARDIRA